MSFLKTAIVTAILAAFLVVSFPSAAQGEVTAAWPEGMAAPQNEHFVAPDGSADNAGTEQSPWDLASVLQGEQTLEPGSVVWVRGGTYKGGFASKISGAENAPIIVRAYPGERATLDGYVAGEEPGHNTLNVEGAWVWFWGLEITNTNPKRSTEQTGSWPSDMKGGGLRALGHDLKFIHLTIHDCQGGFGTESWQTAQNIEVNGCLIYYNGWNAPDRAHGHGIYGQNRDGYQKLIDNIIFHQFSHGIHVYGSGAAFLNNFTLEGNICFENGSMGRDGGRNILLGGGVVAENARVLDNYTYYSGGGANNFGYGAGAKDVVMRGNYFANHAQLIRLEGTVTDNTFFSAEGLTDAQVADNAIGRPETGQAFVRPSLYEDDRAHIAVFNLEREDTVNVDVSDAISPGTDYVVRDAQNFFGEPVASGRYEGGEISIPMTSTKVANPVGDAEKPEHTAPEFAAFVLLSEAASEAVGRGAR